MSLYKSTGKYTTKFKNIVITAHASKRLKERLGKDEDHTQVVNEVWDKQRGPLPAWNVPRIKNWTKKRYLRHIDKDFVFIFEVIDRSKINKRALVRLITVVGPLSEDRPWRNEDESDGV